MNKNASGGQAKYDITRNVWFATKAIMYYYLMRLYQGDRSTLKSHIKSNLMPKVNVTQIAAATAAA
jgi:hypothetical protein